MVLGIYGTLYHLNRWMYMREIEGDTPRHLEKQAEAAAQAEKDSWI